VEDLQSVLLLIGALLATSFFAVLRSALLHSVPARVLEHSAEEPRRRLAPLLERAEALAISASIFEITFQALFLVGVLRLIDALEWLSLAIAILVSVPLLVFASESLPMALRGDRSDALLRAVLPTFDFVQKPLAALIYGMEALQRGVMRLFRIPEKPRSARRIVEVLRDVIEESDIEGELHETERELIENVVEFHDVDVAEVMTPRTELSAVEVESGVQAVIGVIAETGHTRIPVYASSLDSILGLAYAQDVIELVSRDALEACDLRGILRPVSFVPETKRVTELLTEFRRDKQKTAVVVDEYGGTAGLVSMGDIVAEIVGDMRQELGEDAPAQIRRLEDGTVEILAGMRVSEVNEELELDLPEEEDYETLAGFVLSEFGRFPKRDESFVKNEIEFQVVEASDRRVLVVRVRRLEPQEQD
jgi:CBS domain containing-hemolysin-like protein